MFESKISKLIKKTFSKQIEDLIPVCEVVESIVDCVDNSQEIDLLTKEKIFRITDRLSLRLLHFAENIRKDGEIILLRE